MKWGYFCVLTRSRVGRLVHFVRRSHIGVVATGNFTTRVVRRAPQYSSSSNYPAFWYLSLAKGVLPSVGKGRFSPVRVFYGFPSFFHTLSNRFSYQEGCSYLHFFVVQIRFRRGESSREDHLSNPNLYLAGRVCPARRGQGHL